MSLEEQIINHELLTSYRLDQIKRFFFHVHYNKYAAKILITRRAYVLFKMFSDIMTSPEDSNKIVFWDTEILKSRICPKDHSILNSHSLNYINKIIDDTPEEKRAGLKFLLVDDIVIHGRTISKEYERISHILNNKHIPSQNIDVWCLDLNKAVYSLPCIKIPRNQIKVFWNANEGIWKNESNRLTKLILLWKKGYTSIVNVYKYEMSFKNIKNYFKYQSTKYILIKSDSVEGESIPEKNEVCYVFLKEDIEEKRPFLSTIRFVAEDENSSETIAIPFVIPNNVCIKDLTSLYNRIRKKYTDFPNIPGCFDKIDKSIDAALLFYKWIIFKASSLFNDIIINEMHCSCTKVFSCDESYHGLECGDDNELTAEHFDDIYKPEENLLSEIKECIKCFKESLPKNENTTIDYYAALMDYLQTIKKKDEDRAVIGKSRYIGLQINRLLNLQGISYKDNKDIETPKNPQESNYKQNEYLINCDLKLLSAMFRSWDDGTSSGVVEAIKNDSDKYEVGLFTKHGEQIFAAIYKSFKREFLALSLYNHYDMSFNDTDIKQFTAAFEERTHSYNFKSFFQYLKKYGVDTKKLKTEISALSLLFYDSYNNKDEGLINEIEHLFDSLFLNHKRIW